MSDQYGRSMIEDDFPRQRAKNRELSERLDRMELDRDEQVKRLAEIMDGSYDRDLNTARRQAERLYEAGARIPDPPRPSLPVVGDRAVECLYGHRGSDLKDRLALAFPIMFWDTVKALELHPGGMVTQYTLDKICEMIAGPRP